MAVREKTWNAARWPELPPPSISMVSASVEDLNLARRIEVGDMKDRGRAGRVGTGG